MAWVEHAELLLADVIYGGVRILGCAGRALRSLLEAGGGNLTRFSLFNSQHAPPEGEISFARCPA